MVTSRYSGVVGAEGRRSWYSDRSASRYGAPHGRRTGGERAPGDGSAPDGSRFRCPGTEIGSQFGDGAQLGSTRVRTVPSWGTVHSDPSPAATSRSSPPTSTSATTATSAGSISTRFDRPSAHLGPAAVVDGHALDPLTDVDGVEHLARLLVDAQHRRLALAGQPDVVARDRGLAGQIADVERADDLVGAEVDLRQGAVAAVGDPREGVTVGHHRRRVGADGDLLDGLERSGSMASTVESARSVTPRGRRRW